MIFCKDLQVYLPVPLGSGGLRKPYGQRIVKPAFSNEDSGLGNVYTLNSLLITKVTPRLQTGAKSTKPYRALAQ